MQKSIVHKARDLSPDERRVLEALLGSAIEEDEMVTVRASKGAIIREAPTGEARKEAFRRLSVHADKMAERVKGVPEDELNALIDEAVAETRRHRR